MSSPFRSFSFDRAILVLFSAEDYSVRLALDVPVGIVEAQATHRPHVNGAVLSINRELLNLPGVTEVTEDLVNALETL
jgi:hypothetical protein